MAGLDDLIGGLTKAKAGGGGLEDALGGLLGASAKGGGGAGGLGDVLGGLLGGAGKGGAGGGLGDVLGGVLGRSGGSSPGTASGGPGLGGILALLAPVLAGLLRNGGLPKILSRMQASGLSAQADSWVSTNENQGISPDAVRGALGDEVAQVADQLGVDHDRAAELLAGVLPGLVNAVTPEGQVPGDHDLDRLVEAVHGATRS
jgi:uncharacterized protein YidB (DUF937 family)